MSCVFYWCFLIWAVSSDLRGLRLYSCFPDRCLLINRQSDGGVDPAQYQPECSHFPFIYKLARRTVGWAQPSASRNAHTICLLTGRNARDFSNSQGGRWGGPYPVPARMLTLFVYVQDGMPAIFQNHMSDGGMGPAQYQPECSHFLFIQNRQPDSGDGNL